MIENFMVFQVWFRSKKTIRIKTIRIVKINISELKIKL